MNAVRQDFQMDAWAGLTRQSDFTHGIRAVFFDFEGVIRESRERAEDRCWSLLSREAPWLLDRLRDRAGAPEAGRRIGSSTDQTPRHFRITVEDMERLREELEGLTALTGEDPTLARGAREYLESHFGRHDFFLLADCEQSWLDSFCARHRLAHCFRHVAGGPRRKARWLKRLMRAFGLEPETAVYVGATAADYALARKAGLRFIGVGPGLNAGDCNGVPLIDDLGDLDRAMARLGAERRWLPA